MKAEIVSIGTELLLGDIVNTNAQYLAKRLAELGVNVYHQTVVGDNPERILEAYEQAFRRAELVVASGGLGPTEDDLTKEMAAAYFGRKMIHHPVIWEPIEAYYRSRGSKPVLHAKKQADFPEGSEILDNHHGTAPGCWIKESNQIMAMLPGPPREMIPMFERQVVPRLTPYLDQTFQSTVLRICGLGESNVEESLRHIIRNQENPTIATYAKEGEVHVRITARDKTVESARALLEPIKTFCYQQLQEYIYGEGEESLEERIFDLLQEKHLTVSVAESLTGGLLTARLVNVPGMSHHLLGGYIPYTNQAKTNQLGIPTELISRYGVVSREIALEMASRTAGLTGSDIGISTTGWAGISQQPRQSAGLVWMGFYDRGNTFAIKAVIPGDRNRTRFMAANMALCWLLKHLQK